MFHRTQAAALSALNVRGAESAVEELNQGFEKMRQVFVDYNADEEFKEDELLSD